MYRPDMPQYAQYQHDLPNLYCFSSCHCRLYLPHLEQPQLPANHGIKRLRLSVNEISSSTQVRYVYLFALPNVPDCKKLHSTAVGAPLVNYIRIAAVIEG